LIDDMNLSVKMLSGKVVAVVVDENSTVLQLKIAIEQTENMTPQQQRLIFQGKPLDDTAALSSCGIADGTSVFLVRAMQVATPVPAQEAAATIPVPAPAPVSAPAPQLPVPAVPTAPPNNGTISSNFLIPGP